MIDPLSLAYALIAGIMLGVIFFGSLLWTVRKGVSAKHPAFWFFGSMLLRTGITLGGFYLIAGTDWKRLLFCLLGFIIARWIVTRLTNKVKTSYEPL